ncbi:MAG: leucine-rich repeat protein [Oscillospiraceae bacterium]|nr:leucine-rich repeat protein [Oscillospiraceae bacterium]
MKRHKLTAMIAAAVMGLTALPAPIASAAEDTASGTCGEALTWVLDEGGTLTISGTGDMEEYGGWNRAPWYSQSHTIEKIIVEPGVTSIGSYAFEWTTHLTEVTFPESVQAFGTGVFLYSSYLDVREETDPLIIVNHIVVDGSRCTGDVNIPDDVTAIAGGAFRTGRADHVHIGDGVTSIGEEGFDSSTVFTITGGAGVTELGESVFAGCHYLTEVSIDGPVTEIPRFACNGDEKLVRVSMPHAQARTIGVSAFNGCTALAEYEIPETVEEIGECAFYACSALRDVTLPAGLQTLGEEAFRKAGIRRAVLSDNITQIEPKAFTASYLEELVIGAGVTGIARNALDDTFDLRSITVSPDNPTYASEGGLLYNKEKTELLLCPQGIQGTVRLADTLTSIDSELSGRAFSSVVIPESVETIGSFACANCSQLEAVTILNPDCEISGTGYTFSNRYDTWDNSYTFTGTIYGYTGSTAQAFAETYGDRFISLDALAQAGTADLNADGSVSVLDAVMLQKYLVRQAVLIDPQLRLADLSADQRVDVADMTLLKQELLR